MKRIYFFLNSVHKGGSEEYVVLVASELVKLGYSITIVSNGTNRLEELKKLGIKHKRLRMPSIHTNDYDELSIVKKIYFKLIKYIVPLFFKKVDVIFSQHPGPSLVANELVKKYNLKHYNFVHHIIPNEYSDVYNLFDFKVDKFIAVSNEIKDFLKDKNINNVTVVPNPIVYDDFKQIEKLEQIILVGHVHKLKTLSVLTFLEVATQFPEYDFKIAGNINNEFAQELIEKYSEYKNIKFLGELYTTELYEEITKSKILVGVGRSAMDGIGLGTQTIVAGHVVGKNGGNYGGLVTRENFYDLAYNNFSGRNSTELITSDKLMNDIKNALDINQTDVKLINIAKKYNSLKTVVNKIVNIIEDIK